MAKMLRVNMNDLSVQEIDVPEQYAQLGGRGLTSQLVLDEVDPLCHPLGPNNKLVFAPGIVTGTAAPSSGRISAGAKSPLTGGIKESNAGSPFALSLAKLGVKALVIEGQAEPGKFYLLKLDKDSAALEPVDEFVGKSLYETMDAWHERLPDYDFAAVGVSGEMKMAMAGICYNDPEYRASRYSGRGGMGAVMGSKGLKGIAVARGGPSVSLMDEDVFKTGQRKLVEALRTHDITKPGGTLNSYGTAALINVLSQAGGLPVNNFREGTFEFAEQTSGEMIAELCAERGGKGMMGHSCHPGCVIRCSNVFPAEDGSEMASCIEYESDWSLGANLGVSSLDDIARMITICNDVGVDTIEAGVMLGVAMEAGLAEFGDAPAAIKMLEEIRQGTPLGRILGNGASFTGKAFGVLRVPTVKSQGMPAYEPRAVKGIGITYSTSTMGADHTAGYTIAPEILSVGGSADALDPTNKSELSRNFQAISAFIDQSGYCLFIAFAIADIPSGMEGMVESINGVVGTDWTADDVVRVGLEIMKKERQFNEAAGFTRADDRPPEFMRYEPLPPHNHVYDVSDADLDEVWNF